MKRKPKPKRTSARSTRLLAERITTYLFTPGGFNKKADRLGMIFDGHVVCGWGYGPATDAVGQENENCEGQAMNDPYGCKWDAEVENIEEAERRAHEDGYCEGPPLCLYCLDAMTEERNAHETL